MARTKKVVDKSIDGVINEDGTYEQPPMKRITPMRQKFLDKIESIRERKKNRK